MKTNAPRPIESDLTGSDFDLSVDNVVFGFDGDQLQVLLIGLTGEDMRPEQFHMAIPGDLVKANEGLDEAAHRILSSLTSLKGVFLKQFYAFGAPDRVIEEKDREWLMRSRRYPKRRAVTVGYYSLVSIADYLPVASSFASKAEWCPLADIPPLTFDHNEIVAAGLERLRQDVAHHNIIFELLPEKFTLGQLQRLHEIILGKSLDKRNFRKNVKRMREVVPLDEKQAGVLHKPAQLYTYKKSV